MQTAFSLPLQSGRLKENQCPVGLSRDFGFGGRFGRGRQLRRPPNEFLDRLLAVLIHMSHGGLV
jgi:hypothetical protein